MSLYSNSLKTEVFEPRVDTANRTEFRLDKDNVYFGNMRLTLGVETAGGADDAYNPVAGAAGYIKRITLLDGATELDKCDNANRYVAWFQQGGSNDNSRYVEQKLMKHKIGYKMNDNQFVEGDANGEADVSGDHPIKRSAAVEADAGQGAEDQARNRAQAYLDLRVCLPFLQAIGVIDTALFENLIIRVEYENIAVQSGAQMVATTATQNALSKIRPLLLVDEIKDPALREKSRREIKSFNWNVYEHDMVQVPNLANPAGGANPDTTPDLVQQTTRLIDGFKNKYVSRMVFLKTYTDKSKNLLISNAAGNVVRGVGDYASHAMHKEKVQIVLNGRQIFTGAGLEGPAQIADVYADTWGDYLIMPFQNVENVGLDSIGIAAPSNTFGVQGKQRETAGQAVRVGQHSWIGARLEDRVSNLQLKYERAVSVDSHTLNPTGAGLDIHIYAEIPKQFVLSGGKYKINYL